MISGEPISKDAAKIKFDEILKINNSNQQLGYFLITCIQSKDFIGLGKIVTISDDEVEIGYLVEPNFWSMGFGGEISAELVKHARSLNFVKNAIAIIDPENTASKRILLKSSFYLDETFEMDGLPAEVYKLVL